MTLIEWLFTPLPVGLIIAAILRYLIGFTSLTLAARYRRDRCHPDAGLALVFGILTLAGGLSVEQNPNAQVTPYALGWLLSLEAILVCIILRRAAREAAHD